MWFLGYVVAVLIGAYLVREYAEPKTPAHIKLIVGFSWALGFSYFLVLPFDISGAFCRVCSGLTAFAPPVVASSDAFSPESLPHPSPPPAGGSCSCYWMGGLEALEDIIPICYGLTMLNGYLMNDLLRSYHDSGEFTRRGRLHDALKDAAIFYVPALIIGIVFLVLMIVQGGLDFSSVRALGRGFINAIGLFILIAFLGYGFVEVPRYLMNKANTEGQLRYYKFRVAVQSEALQNGRRKLEETLELVHQTDVALRGQPHSVLHEHMAVILRRCPRSSRSAHGTQQLQPASRDGDVTSAPPTPPDPEAASTPFGRAGVGRCGNGNGGGGGEGGQPAGTDEKLLPNTKKGLVALHLRLKRALANEKRQRAMYEMVRARAAAARVHAPPASCALARTRGSRPPLALAAPPRALVRERCAHVARCVMCDAAARCVTLLLAV